MEDFFNAEDEDFEFEEEDELIARYENMLKNRQAIFLSVDDYEELYLYYVNLYMTPFFFLEEDLVKGGSVIKAAISQYPDSEIIQVLQHYHHFRVDKITQKELVGRLSAMPFPAYEQERFRFIMAHIYRQADEKNKALAMLESLFESAYSADDKIELCYEILFLYETADDVPQAIKCCEVLLNTRGINQEVLFWEVYDYFFLKPIAIPFFEQLTQRYSFSVHTWLYLGKSYADMAMYEESIQALKYAVAISDNVFPLIWLGRVYAVSGNIPEAFQCLQEAMQIDSSRVELYTEMGELLYGMDDYTQATCFFSLALDINKCDVNALIGMALVLSSQERYDESIGYIMRVKKIESLSSEALLLLADNYIEVNRDDEALDIYEQLLLQYPKDVDVWLSYSNYYAMIEDFQHACAIAKQGLSILHGNPLLLYRIANYYILEGDISHAITYLRLAYHTNADCISVFIDYDEDVMKNPVIADIVNYLKSES